MFDSDNTVILIFPKIEKGKLAFYVSKNSNWDQSMFFPYLSLDENEDINEKNDIIMKISQKFNLSFAIDYEYLQKMDHENTKLNSKLERDAISTVGHLYKLSDKKYAGNEKITNYISEYNEWVMSNATRINEAVGTETTRIFNAVTKSCILGATGDFNSIS